MNSNPTPLDIHQIKAYLGQRYHPYLDKTVIFDEISSTNTYLLQQAQKQNHAACICLAEQQTAGRGRFNRQWISPLSGNIYLSVWQPFSQALTQLSGLSLAIAVAITRALKRYGIQENIDVKWPNDLLWQHRKLGGILIELQQDFSRCDVVMGIGLNLSMPEKLQKAAGFSCVDLSEITGLQLNRNKLLGFLLDELFDAWAVFQAQGLQPFMMEFSALDCTLGKAVKMSQGDVVYEGIGCGIDEAGYFLLEDIDGKIQRFIGGEASLHVEKD